MGFCTLRVISEELTGARFLDLAQIGYFNQDRNPITLGISIKGKILIKLI